MTDEQQTILMITGAIFEMPREVQDNYVQAYSAIRAIEEKYGDVAGRLAICMRGAELAAEGDK